MVVGKRGPFCQDLLIMVVSTLSIHFAIIFLSIHREPFNKLD